MREGTLEKNLVKFVKKLGGEAVKFQTIYERDNPDRLILLPGGIMAFVEVKTTGKNPRPGQKVRIKQLRKLGFKVYLVDDKVSLDMVKDFLKQKLTAAV